MSILLGAAMVAAMASGQDFSTQRVAPRGSYAQTCSDSYTNQGRLYADCRDERGQIRGTSIELARCSGDEIVNMNGLLVCGRTRGEYEDRGPGRPGRPGQGGDNGGGWGNGRTPQGSYTGSCNAISVRGDQLTATCRDTRRNERTSTLNISRCGRADISNDNGLLVCGPQRGQWVGGGNGGGWGGGNGGWGRTAITVYDNANFRGSSREFVDEDTNLGRTPFNDRIVSIRVQGRWEVCTDANFRGRCRVIDRDVSRLDGNFYRSISSLRPVGRR
nr:beta/gamma crystallin-related protein [uncultured Brevundimonas sp.]